MTRFTRKSAPAATFIRKRAPTEIKALDAAQGIVTAYVNTLGAVDHDGDVIEPGAFMRSLARGKRPVVCWMHNWADVIGQVTEATEETSAGEDGIPVTRLLATMQFDMDDPAAVRYFGKVRKGYTDEWSVGFYALAETYERAGDTMTRHITDLDWCEVSPVLRGASPGTTTVSAKVALNHDAKEVRLTADDLCPRCQWARGLMQQLGQTDPFDGRAEATPTVQPAETSGTLEPQPARTDDTAPATSPDAAGTEEATARFRLASAALALQGISPAPTEPDTKRGARNSSADTKRIQAAHDLLCDLGAACTPPEA